mmetsp:Transcript_8916/g.36825  ORF Transcript_8916/g.36825 Transcript_8916/m.36825 type:complete len:485 (+) Transcript_8916:162-1616(+)
MVQKRLKIGALGTVICLFILLQLATLIPDRPLQRRVPLKEWEESSRPALEKAAKLGLLEDMLVWPGLVEGVHVNGTGFDLPTDMEGAHCWKMGDCTPVARRAMEFGNCWRKDSWLHMHENRQCALSWLEFLEHQAVEKVDNTLSVVMSAERKLGVAAKSNQNGGARMHFKPAWGRRTTDPVGSTDLMGYWKPCAGNLPGNAEDFRNEIAAFHLDHILGFYRTPVVVPRFFSAVNMREMFTDGKDHASALEELIKVQSMLDRCGSNNKAGVEGAMVGWSKWGVVPLDKKHSDLKKRKLSNMVKPNKDVMLSDGTFNITRESPKAAQVLALENVAVNMFSVLTGNRKKFSHSVFISYKRNPHGAKVYGPLLYIDNDRSNWYSNSDTLIRHTFKENHPLTEICRFPESIALRLLALRYSPHSVGDIAKRSTDVYSEMYESPILTQRQVDNINNLADFLTDAVEACIHRYGVDSVLIPLELDGEDDDD